MDTPIATPVRTSDAALLEASRRGEHAAFGEIVERYQRLVSAVSYARTRDRTLSDDVTQDTFLAAWRQLDQVREPRRLGAWLCGIARNRARRAHRDRAREVPLEGQAVAETTPFDDVSAAQAEHVVGVALARVSETCRDVLVLYFQEQMSVREVAEALGISEAAAMKRLARGRQQLASTVTALVETSLRNRRRRNVVAGVLAALPLLDASPGDAAAGRPRRGITVSPLIAAAPLAAAVITIAVVVIVRRPPARSVGAAATSASRPVAARPPSPRAPGRPAPVPPRSAGRSVATRPDASDPNDPSEPDAPPDLDAELRPCWINFAPIKPSYDFDLQFLNLDERAAESWMKETHHPTFASTEWLRRVMSRDGAPRPDATGRAVYRHQLLVAVMLNAYEPVVLESKAVLTQPAAALIAAGNVAGFTGLCGTEYAHLANRRWGMIAVVTYASSSATPDATAIKAQLRASAQPTAPKIPIISIDARLFESADEPPAELVVGDLDELRGMLRAAMTPTSGDDPGIITALDYAPWFDPGTERWTPTVLAAAARSPWPIAR
jgi:RNA polymerase sigma-70 factor (ECF subfamily)